MTRNERDLLTILGQIAHDPEAFETNRGHLKKIILALVESIKREAIEIKPGDMVAVKVVATKVQDGLIYFKSDDGTEVYRRVSDIVSRP